MNKKLILSLGIILIIAILSTVGYFAYSFFNQNNKNQSKNDTKQEDISNETKNWKTYKNEKLNLSVKYPEGWEKKEEDENHIIFTNPSDHSKDIYVSIDEESLESVVEKGLAGPVRNIKEEDVIINGKKVHRISAEFLIEDIGQGEEWSLNPSVFTYIPNNSNNRTFTISTDSSDHTIYEKVLLTLSIDQ